MLPQRDPLASLRIKQGSSQAPGKLLLLFKLVLILALNRSRERIHVLNIARLPSRFEEVGTAARTMKTVGNSWDKPERRKTVAKRSASVLMQKCRRPKEAKNLAVVLKGVSCYSSKSLIRGSHETANSDLTANTPQTGETPSGELTMEQRGAGWEGERVVTKITDENAKPQLSRTDKQHGVERSYMQRDELMKRQCSAVPLGHEILHQDARVDEKENTRTEFWTAPMADSRAVVCPVVEGHKMCYNQRREGRLEVKTSGLPRCHVGANILQPREHVNQVREAQWPLKRIRGCELAGRGMPSKSEHIFLFLCPVLQPG